SMTRFPYRDHGADCEEVVDAVRGLLEARVTFHPELLRVPSDVLIIPKGDCGESRTLTMRRNARARLPLQRTPNRRRDLPLLLDRSEPVLCAAEIDGGVTRLVARHQMHVIVRYRLVRLDPVI